MLSEKELCFEEKSGVPGVGFHTFKMTGTCSVFGIPKLEREKRSAFMFYPKT